MTKLNSQTKKTKSISQKVPISNVQCCIAAHGPVVARAHGEFSHRLYT